ncbi:energy transducer TonB [Roseivirga sp. E12]|uniref:energy transducer TonB n=1 Tax=Roseivirga sp. E12 TaxID=2819237 RepID=UPI001ABCD7DB|nr:TonB family protein [Roseivirga sp. E12]
MDKKNKHIDQLTPEIIKAYRSGELTAEQKHQVEVLMLENPLYAEGMEGVESIGLADLSTDLDELTARLDQATDSKVSPFWTLYRRVAAIALLLITSLGLFYLLNDQSPLPTQELSDAKKPTTETPKDSSANNKIEPSVETKSTPEAEIVQETEIESVKDQIQTTKRVTRDPIAENEPEGLKPFSSEAPKEVEIQAAAPREITLPMRTFDKSLDSVVEVNLTWKDQRSIKQEVLSLSENASKRKLDDSALRNSFAPQNTPEALENLTISGKVTGSDDGLPLPQVSVFVKGTILHGIGTTQEGTYGLDSIRPGSTIVFRYLGYITQEVKLDTSAVLNIQLVPDATSLGEVVVTGIGLNDEEEEDVSTFAIAKPEGGYPNFNRYLRRNLKYPETAKEQKVRGRVTLEFDVSATGDLSNFKIIKGLGFGCDKEAIRLVKEGPKWNPRTEGVDKRPVSSTVKIRVRFRP